MGITERREKKEAAAPPPLGRRKKGFRIAAGGRNNANTFVQSEQEIACIQNWERGAESIVPDLYKILGSQ